MTVPTSEIGTVSTIPGWGALGETEGVPEAPALRWPENVRTYSKMRNDTQIESLCNSVTMPVMRLKWSLNPNGARDEVVQQMSTDLGLPILGSNDPAPRSRRRFKHSDHLSHALLALWYGHMFFEQVPDTERYDLATDGWRLRKLSPRMPGGIQSIHVAKDGGLEGISQYGYRAPRTQRQGLALLGNGKPQIPVDALVAYVWKREGANWRGRSMLRPLYAPWILKDRALRVDAMKNERFGMGIPTGRAPEGGDPTQYANLARSIRAGEASGVGLPAGADVGVEGIRGTLPDVLASIRYYDESMARSFMAMVIQLGQTETGSRALGTTFADFFQMLVEAVADWYKDTTNEHVIEDMVDCNWDEDEQAPLLQWSYADDEEPLAVSDFVSMVREGIITMDAETEKFVREKSNLPDIDEADRESLRVDASQSVTSVTKRKGVRKGVPKITVASAGERRFAARKQTVDDPVIGHREPNEIELASKTDFEVLQERWQDATADLVATWRDEIQATQIDALVEQVREAVESGNTVGLVTLSAPVEGTETLLAAMREMAEDALVGAKEEAAAQGAPIGTVNTAESVEPLIAARAEATATLMARGISESAGRAAINLGTEALAADVVADAVREHLEGLTDAYVRDMLGGAMTQAQNTGRRAVMDERPGRIYSSELLDQNTCENCSGVDTTEYTTLQDAEQDYPVGGYRECLGGPRCRGTLVAVYDEAEPS